MYATLSAWIHYFSWERWIEFFYLVLVLAFWVRIVMHRRPAGINWAWLCLVSFVPLGGMALYLLLGEHKLGARTLRRVRTIEQSRSEWVTKITHLATQEENAAIHPNWSDLSRGIFRSTTLPLSANNALALYSNTLRTWGEVLVQDIDQAQHSVWFTFYIWSEGGVADTVGVALMRAAKRGVRCRVLLDGAGSADFWRSEWPEHMRTAGIALVNAFPVKLLRAFDRRVDLRMHRKSIVIDERIAYTGSMNMVDPRYFKQSAGVGEWVDATVRIVGPAAREQLALSSWDWNMQAERAQMVSLGELNQTPSTFSQESNATAFIQVVPSGPLPQEGEPVVDVLLTALYRAQKSVTLTTPYFVPYAFFSDAMASAAKRGVRVRLIVPDQVDSVLVRYASRSYYEQLLEAGVEIYQFKGGLLHTKSILIDDDLALFGTLNLDFRSFALNFELTLLILQPSFVEALKALQQSYMLKSECLKLDDWKKRPWKRRLAENTMQLFGPLL